MNEQRIAILTDSGTDVPEEFAHRHAIFTIPLAIQFSDVTTKMLFTDRERAAGSFLMATANRLQYMSNTDKLNVSAQMADRGIMNRDEIRAIWNLPPLPDGQGQSYTIRGEYYLLGTGGNATKEGSQTNGT